MSTKQRGIINSFHLLEVPVNTAQDVVALLFCRGMLLLDLGHSAVHQDPRFLQHSCFLTSQSRACITAGCSSFRALHLSVLNFIRVQMCLQCQSPSEWQALSSCISIIPLNLVSPAATTEHSITFVGWTSVVPHLLPTSTYDTLTTTFWVYPSSSPFIQTVMSKCEYKNIVGDRVECLTYIKVNEIHCSSLIQQFSHFTIESNQASHEWFTFDKSMPIVLNHFLLVPRNAFQEHACPYFPKEKKEGSQLSSSLDRILGFFEGCNICPFPVIGKLSWSPRCFKDAKEGPHCDSGQLYQHCQTQSIWPHRPARQVEWNEVQH